MAPTTGHALPLFEAEPVEPLNAMPARTERAGVPELKLRALRPPDHAEVGALLRRVVSFEPAEVLAAQARIEGFLSLPPSAPERVIGAFVGERLVGLACAGPSSTSVHGWDLYWLAVDPTAHGRGIGARLIEAVDAHAGGHGGRILRAEMSGHPQNLGTLAFYRRAGFSIAGRIPDFYANDDDLVTLYRPLRPRPRVAAA
ncbi:MAG: GNAT family N-acetyltransferase [Myxococcales bacterium]|nr:GNAT family N-acetyltransferase [Myxococcales bacterium]MCB9551471.1 GNAT family N-acetyltransferase [Myxococcales bacterium]